MLEQLKEIILEMELLLQDCCHPVLSKRETNFCDETDSNIANYKNLKDSKANNSHQNFIRVDPSLRKIFSSLHSEDLCEEECSIEERKLKKKVSMYKLKSSKIPVHYQSIFMLDSETDNGIDLQAKVELPVKMEYENDKTGKEFEESSLARLCYTTNSKCPIIPSDHQKSNDGILSCTDHKVKFKKI
jgi:hypothetical protein